MSTLEQKIINSRDIKPSTLKIYMSNLRTLYNSIETPTVRFDIPDWLYIYETHILEFIYQYAQSTQKNYLSAVLVALSTDIDKYIDVYERYFAIHKKLADDISAEQLTQEKNEKQAENWVSMAELTDIVDSLHADVISQNLYQLANWDKNQFDLFQRFLVGSLYTKLPPIRLDYSGMGISTLKDYNSLLEKKDNYLVIENMKKKYFVFNDYKTVDKYGEKIIPIPQEINDILNTWLIHNKSGVLLLDSNRRPMSRVTLSRYLNKIFAPTGKNISVTMLRHIFLSNEFPAQAQKMKDLADQMGHSIATQQNIYVKK